MAAASLLSITSINEYGYGVGQKGGQTLTVARTAVGDQVQIGAPKSKERWSSADLVRVTKAGPDRVKPGCEAFSAGCGGCQWQHLSYQAQVQWKQKNLESLLRQRAGYRGTLSPLVQQDSPAGYRNKLSLKTAGGRLVFVPEFDQATVAPADCPVQTPALQRAWAVLRVAKVHPLIEQVHLRSNDAGQIGAHVFAKDGAGLDAGLSALGAALPGCVGLGVTTRGGYRTAFGEPSLTQAWGGVSWRIPHNGFFQTNAVQAGALLELVIREARATKADRVLDLYCGSGFFGLALAASAGEVVGIEENPQSVAAAEASARASGVQARFLAGDLGPVLAGLERHPREIAVVDPPREGLLPKALEALKARQPGRIIYISCHPASLARDLKVLLAAGWRGVACTPVDMFPHTSHVETVVTLQR